MTKSVPIRISKELRDALGGMRMHPSESYDMLLRRKLTEKRSRKNHIKAQLFPSFAPGKATNKVLKSDMKVTKDFLGLI
jgi:hypothetical protein